MTHSHTADPALCPFDMIRCHLECPPCEETHVRLHHAKRRYRRKVA